MRDALLFQEDDHLQEVFAEALQKVYVEPAFLAEPVAEGFGAGTTHEQTYVVSDLDRIEMFDDMLVAMELLEYLPFAAKSIVVFRRRGDLEHKFLVILLDQQDYGASTGAKSLLDEQVARQLVAHLGLGRVFDDIVVGIKQFLLDFVEVFEKVTNRVDPVGYVRVRAVLD